MPAPAAIAEWARGRADWPREVMPDAPKCLPCAAIHSNVLRTIEAEELTQNNQVRQAIGNKRAGGVTLPPPAKRKRAIPSLLAGCNPVQSPMCLQRFGRPIFPF